jgi:hypothetical protein
MDLSIFEKKITEKQYQRCKLFHVPKVSRELRVHAFRTRSFLFIRFTNFSRDSTFEGRFNLYCILLVFRKGRTKLDRYLSIYHEDFRYFRDKSTDESLSIIHPILVSVSNQLDSYVEFVLFFDKLRKCLEMIFLRNVRLLI